MDESNEYASNLEENNEIIEMLSAQLKAYVFGIIEYFYLVFQIFSTFWIYQLKPVCLDLKESETKETECDLEALVVDFELCKRE